jgi:hypothetical protein
VTCTPFADGNSNVADGFELTAALMYGGSSG